MTARNPPLSPPERSLPINERHIARFGRDSSPQPLCLRFISVGQVDLPRSYPSRRDDQKWKKGQIRLTPRRGSNN